jgi:tRNA modification GTPase
MIGLGSVGRGDTIFARASAPGRAGVAVVRISGPAALAAVSGLAGPLPNRGRVLRVLRGPDGAVLDEALILTFPAGHSFTGEEVVEIHCHGSLAVTNAVLAALARAPGLRGADPGEFTFRAFENGRLDLSQVEALADLIDAETDAQRQQALRQFQGAVGDWLAGLRSDLLDLLAELAIMIDFVDEDVPEDLWDSVSSRIGRIRATLERESAGYGAAERIRDGFVVAIIGRPNSGKSTLLNRLAGREVALTSDVPGTTRDTIEVHLELSGLPVTIVDTAGIRETLDPVERLGVSRSRQRGEAADLRVFLLAEGETSPLVVMEGDIVVRPFADRFVDARGAVSGLTGLGVPQLLDRIGETLLQRTAGAGKVTTERQAELVKRAIAQLDAAAASTCRRMPEIVAEDLRLAVVCLDRLVGRIDVEDVLGRVFGRFCIGK